MVGHRVRLPSRSGARSGAAALLVVALAALSACSSDADTLDQPATERAVTKAVQADLPQTVERVTCPEPIPLGESTTVRCQAELTGVVGAMGLDVEQVADDELDVTLLDAVIDPALVADELERQLLATYLRTFTADCGAAGAEVLAPGSTVPCTVADDADGVERAATATVDDAAGTLRFSVAGAPEPSEAAEEADPPGGSDGPTVSFGPAPDPTAAPATEPSTDGN